MASSLARQWRFIDKVLQNMRFKRAAKHVPGDACLLDIGCGDGEFLHDIADRLRYGIGVDSYITKECICRNNGPKIALLSLDVNEGFPLPRDYFDAVTALAVVEHICDIELLFSEVHRVLRKGGRFIFTTPSPQARPILELLAYRYRIISYEDIMDHKRYLSYETAVSLLSDFASITYSTFQLGLNQLFVAVK